ncbi:hypothetical protein BZA70DRAFT_204879 [Myxozyma melibiosi]|uniref:DNA polymerase n=1 Tax=Myxozyma melibiosi TaxID=54550 RepID=A0ABR1F2W6_9ASCO
MSRLQKLREARRLKAQGQSVTALLEDDAEHAIYDEVDDASFKKLVQDRLMGDDFVVDDNGLGYADNGTYDWEPEETYYSDEVEEAPGKPGKKQKSLKETTKKQKSSSGKLFSTTASSASTKRSSAPKIMDDKEEENFLEDILGEVESSSKAKKPKPSSFSKLMSNFASSTRKRPESRRARSPVRDYSPENMTSLHNGLPSSPTPSLLVKPEPSYDDSGRDLNNAPMETSAAGKVNDAAYESDDDAWDEALMEVDNGDVKDEDAEEPDDDEAMEIERPIAAAATDVKRVNISASKAAPTISKIVKPQPTPKIEAPVSPEGSQTWTQMNNNIGVIQPPSIQRGGSSSIEKVEIDQVAEPDGSVRMFWTDFMEVDDRLILIGKTKLNNSDKYLSCMVQVHNIMRKLYFLPRTHKVDMATGVETDEKVTTDDVCDEIEPIFAREKIEMRFKTTRRKYAFDLQDVPPEAEYLELLYPYRNRPLDARYFQGATYSHVFGSGTGIFEQFVLMRRIMGPCWIEIKNPTSKDVRNMSWTRCEVGVRNPADVSVLPEADAPPLNLMSVAVRSILNSHTNKQEIVAISGRVYENIPHDTNESPDSLRPYVFTIVRPITGGVFPAGFEAEVRRKGRGTFILEKTEQTVLSRFLERVRQHDPDCFIGHNLEAGDLNILLHRMRERKTQGWSQIGRISLNRWPTGTISTFADRKVVTGRLLCDLANDMGKSVMLKCQSWSLTEMCDLLLGVKRYEPAEIDTRKANNYTDSANGLFDYFSHCELDTHFIASLAIKTQLLPLTKQLTNLAGNSWARTLSGTRSERNEYILMHEFVKNKYIVPDKQNSYAKNGNATKRKRAAAMEDEENNEDNKDDEVVMEANKKKDKYKGGLVFEPEKGLYDKFVLVMDFNSLYPSIIQEYNICFTTVDRSQCNDAEDKVPDPPSSDVPQGVLPRLIATLVNRRRQVKSLMKDPKATAAQKAQWDIKQQALKLTANSMYGCLGYDKSRFYARPLAMLTTYKGREILTNTKELAESMDLKVIYGDTDSVMINTGSESYADALRTGQEFKVAVNERYRLLEIDIDNVFRRLLMHAKKKYAALNCIELNGKIETKMEVKGLDMRRREFCALSKEASTKVLNEILSGAATENVVENIHEYLRELGEQVRGGKIPTAKFIIHTKLSKDPEQYPGGKAMPQVQAALRRKARGERVAANDVIAYIIAAGDGSPADRAFPYQDFMEKPKREAEPAADAVVKKEPDADFYLAKQILPPIERLCGAISGTDAMHLANCLGLDTRKYMISSGDHSSGNIYENWQPLESSISDEERYADAKKLTLSCPWCSSDFIFEGMTKSKTVCTPAGLVCSSCSKGLPLFSIVTSVERMIRLEISRYYEGWVKCNDSSCGNRTRQISVYGKRCIGKDGCAKSCRGVMAYEYSDKTLYTQLRYIDYLFNVEAAKGKGDQEVDALAEFNRSSFETVRAVTGKYLSDCGRRYVDFYNIFGFMK